MKHLILVSVAALALSACQSDSQSQRAATGGLLGAAAGTTVGAIAGNSVGAAVAGGVIGGAAGAIAGAATTPRNCVDGAGRAVPCP